MHQTSLERGRGSEGCGTDQLDRIYESPAESSTVVPPSTFLRHGACKRENNTLKGQNAFETHDEQDEGSCGEEYGEKHSEKDDWLLNCPVSKTVPSAPSVPFQCPLYIRKLCRLVACHSKQTLTEGCTIRFTVDSDVYAYTVRHKLDIGRNVRCLVFVRPLYPIVVDGCLKIGNLEESEVVLAFNWFSPTSLWDYITLGLKLTASSGIEQVYDMCNSASFDQAQEFLTVPALRSFVMDLKMGHIPHRLSVAQSKKLTEWQQLPPRSRGAIEDVLGVHKNLVHARTVTLTGFSMGGATAHAMAVLLKEVHQLPHCLRVVGLGSPRPGNDRLVTWFSRNCTPDSLNIVLCANRQLETAFAQNQAAYQQQGTFHPAVLCGAGRSSVSGVSQLPMESVREELHQTSVAGRQPSTTTDNRVAPHGSPASAAAHLSLQDPLLQVRVYDPATLGPSCTRGFTVHPNLHVVEKGGRGMLTRMSSAERERLKYADLKGMPVNPPPSSAAGRLWHRIGQSHPIEEELHAVLRYYEELTGMG